MNATKTPSLNRLALLLGLVAIGATGCTIAATPPSLSVAGPQVVHTTRVVEYGAPARVYYEGRWLHYRSDGYYYRTAGRWAAAPRVPSHVRSYQRPGRPVHVTGASARRPTHVYRSSGRSSRPTHVGRTTSNRRTYRR